MSSTTTETLVYLSERKLWNMARGRGVPTDHTQRERATDASARLSLPSALGTSASAEIRAHSERVDAQQRARTSDRVLDGVIDSLRRDGLCDLDSAMRTPREGEWFRFHRDLRFGYGSADDDHAVAAAVFVDREPVDECGRGGLLMTGSPWHLREPYRPDEGTEIHGARSGSGTGRLFAWLEAVRTARESDDRTDADPFDDPLFHRDRSPDGPTEPTDMYRLFADDDWMARPRFPHLVHPAPCEGIAQATLVSVCHQTTVIMASPLYLRVLSVPKDEAATESPPPQRSHFHFRRRLPRPSSVAN